MSQLQLRGLSIQINEDMLQINCVLKKNLIIAIKIAKTAIKFRESQINLADLQINLKEMQINLIITHTGKGIMT